MLLTESQLQKTYKSTEKVSGIDPRIKPGFQAMLSDDNVFRTYSEGLAEGLSQKDAQNFLIMAENTRNSLLENSMFQLNPYETLTLPILRVYYPKLIAKELVNVTPIDKPDVVRAFVKPSFQTANSSASDPYYDFPSTSTDISTGPGVGVETAKWTTGGEGITDVLAEACLNSTTSHLEKNFKITGVIDSTSNTATVEIIPSVDGFFSSEVTVGDTTAYISGHVDWEAGTFTWSSHDSDVANVKYQAVCSLEENQINPTIRFDIEKIRLTTIDRRISAEWSINMEQDVKALYDLNLQAELVNIMGEQIAIDIDREIINDLISENSAKNASSHVETFSKTPPATFTWGEKQWYENVLPPLNRLSAQIYNDTHMGAANTLACNPLDAAVFESLNGFEYAGTSVDGGALGFRSATVAGGKWKVLVSSIVPQGTVIAKYKVDEDARASYMYCPYVPALLHPYPLGAIPSLTILTRYATKSIRPEALGVLSITA